MDDNVELAQSIRDLLISAGHAAEVTTDPVVALEVARTFQPDVAILDIEMPVMDGYELGQHLRSLPRTGECLLIAMTGYGQAHDVRRSRESGFAHHLVKPVDENQLLAFVAGG